MRGKRTMRNTERGREGTRITRRMVPPTKDIKKLNLLFADVLQCVIIIDIIFIKSFNQYYN